MIWQRDFYCQTIDIARFSGENEFTFIVTIDKKCYIPLSKQAIKSYEKRDFLFPGHSDKFLLTKTEAGRVLRIV